MTAQRESFLAADNTTQAGRQRYDRIVKPLTRRTVLGGAGAIFGGAERVSASGRGEPKVLLRNGGWCWYQDERAIVAGNKLIFGSVAGSTRDGLDRGDIVAGWVDLDSGETGAAKLAAKFQSDDHDAPAFLELPGGRVLASFMTHGGGATQADTRAMHWRISTRPGDPAEWGPVRKADTGGTISYANLFRLSSENGKIYNFHRRRSDDSPGNNPNYMVSTDGGESFRYGGRLLYWPTPEKSDPKYTGIDGARPYLKYASNNEDTIHFVATEDHPRAYDNSIYHGYIFGGRVYRSDGAEVGPLGEGGKTGIRPTDLTRVFEGAADRVAWTMDLHLDARGNPYTVFSVQTDGAAERSERGATSVGQDHRYWYARWDGSRWAAHEIAFAGTRLYPGEDDYTGLGALHPHDPDTVFISTNAEPESGRPLVSKADGKRHREVFRGVTSDGGRTWAWTPVTRDSAFDNIRPLVPIWKPGRTALLWLRGEFRTYTDFSLDVVGLID
ncbi:MAG: BNR-4 repeat-containing protein [Bryobacteraceae bacterium]